MNKITNAMARAAAQAGDTKLGTFLARDNWMRAVLTDNRLSHQARNSLVRVALYLNIESGRCDPSYEAIASALGCSRRTAIRWIGEGITCGWLAPTSAGRHHNNFRFLWPQTVTNTVTIDEDGTVTTGDTVDSPTVTTGDTVHGPNGDKFDTSTVTDSSTNGDNCCHPEQRITAKRTPKREKDSPPTSPSADGADAKESTTKAEAEDSFGRFWGVYPKRVGKLDAAKAFKAALKLVTADEIIAGAKRYAAERAGQEPRYTKFPAGWLRAGCFLDEAPAGAKPVIDQAGNIVAFTPPQSAGPPKTYAEVVRRRAEARAAPARGVGDDEGGNDV